jgi:hypothetical protein
LRLPKDGSDVLPKYVEVLNTTVLLIGNEYVCVRELRGKCTALCLDERTLRHILRSVTR